MALRFGLVSVVLMLAGPALAQSVDVDRARDAAAAIVLNDAIDQFCESQNSPPFPGYSPEETEAACDIIANSEED